MDSQPDSAAADDLSAMKEQCRLLEESITSRRETQLALISSLQTLIPSLVPSLDLSLLLISAFNSRPFTPIPATSNPQISQNPSPKPLSDPTPPSRRRPNPNNRNSETHPLRSTRPKTSPDNNDKYLPSSSSASTNSDKFSAVRTMVAVCLLELVPFTEIDAAALARRLESDQSSASDSERAALTSLADEIGGSTASAVSFVLRRIADDGGGVQLEELSIAGKPNLMVWGIDRSKLLRELPETAGNKSQQPSVLSSDDSNVGNAVTIPRTPAHQQQQEMWVPQQMFPGTPRRMGVMGMPGMPRMGLAPLQRPYVGPGGTMGGGGVSGPGTQGKQRTEEDDIKDLEELLNKKTYREKQKSKTGEELLDLIHRPTAKETAVAAKV